MPHGWILKKIQSTKVASHRELNLTSSIHHPWRIKEVKLWAWLSFSLNIGILMLYRGSLWIRKIPHLSLKAIFPFPTYNLALVLPWQSHSWQGFFSPRLLNYGMGNGNIAFCESWEIFQSTILFYIALPQLPPRW